MKRTIYILGASTRSAAMSALRAGYEPITADLFGDSDLLRIANVTRVKTYPDGLSEWVRAQLPGPFLYTGAMENHESVLRELPAEYPLLGNRPAILKRIRDLSLFAKTCETHGIPFPEMRKSDKGLPRDGSWLAKTGRGSSGSGVKVYDDLFVQSHRLVKGWTFQKKIKGEAGAAIFVAGDRDAVLLGITRQYVGEAWAHAKPHHYTGSIGPWLLPELAAQTLQKLGSAIATTFSPRGLIGVDFIWDGEHVWPIEINPRYTASVEVVERFTNLHAMDLHVKACEHGTLPNKPCPTDDEFHGKAILFSPHDVEVPEHFTKWAFKQNTDPLLPNVADIPNPHECLHAGTPVATVFASGDSMEATETTLKSRVREMELQLFG